MNTFLKHIEIWLSLVGVGLILAVPGLLIGGSGPFWEAMALTALAVGVVHGLIFWLVRRRQARVREQAISEIRSMLMDRVHNHLTVISAQTLDAESREQVEELQSSIDEISQLLWTLNEESLRSWQARYDSILGSDGRLRSAGSGPG